MRANPLLIAAALSGALHAYLGWRLIPPLDLTATGIALGWSLLLASALLIPAPLLIRLNRLPEKLADGLAWAGYLAMGVFSSLLVLTLFREVLLLLAWGWQLLSGGETNLSPLRKASAQAVLGLSLLVSLIGLFNARRLARVAQVDLRIDGLPAALSGFTIVQLSDIHVGPTIKRGYLDRIVRRVNLLDADLVAITGDVVDGSVNRLREHVAPLGELRSRHGTYCVTGNHEYYHGADAWIAEWRRLGLRVLLNESEVLDHDGERMLVGGVTDFTAHRYHPAHGSDAAAAAHSEHPVAFKLLLAHQPRSAPAAAEAGFDLQLSGHTHGGQFLPWNLFVPMQQPFVSGVRKLGRLLVYTSRGTGYWGPPLRFGAPSEITRLRLVPASS